MKRAGNRLLIAFCGLWLLLAAGPLRALDRNAFTFTSYSLRANIRPAEGDFEASGTLDLRNDSAAPQQQVALQISSSLTWKQILLAGGQPVAYITQTYTSDIDHTGALEEAVINLPEAVPPRGSLKLQVSYGGEISRDSGRLTRIGAPEDVARASDWDEIGERFGAVRGLGYVTWYPVSIEAVSLSEGTTVFAALERWKQRHEKTPLQVTFSLVPSGSGVLQLSLITNGHTTGAAGNEASEAGFSSSKGERLQAATVRAEFSAGATPVFAFGEFVKLERPALTVLHAPEHGAAAQDFAAAAEKAERVLADWFGPLKRKPELVELTDPDAAPFSSGTMLLTSLQSAASEQERELLLARSLVEASFSSPRPWISAGLARFGQALVRERQAGRAAASQFLGKILPALIPTERDAAAPAAASTPKNADDAPAAGPDVGRTQRESLINTHDEVLYSGKAAYVWWMLRDMVGDGTLSKAIASYRPAQDRQPAYMQSLIEAQFTPRKDLEAFFDSWVYRDLGLPDFRIEAANARETLKNTYVVSVTVENLTPVWSEVPVIVRDANNDSRLARVQVPGKSKAIIRITIQGPPAIAEVNDGSVPELDYSNNKKDVSGTGAPSK